MQIFVDSAAQSTVEGWRGGLRCAFLFHMTGRTFCVNMEKHNYVQLNREGLEGCLAFHILGVGASELRVT